MLYVCSSSGPRSHGVGDQATECRNRGAGSHSMRDHTQPHGSCGHWEMTPALFQVWEKLQTSTTSLPLWCFDAVVVLWSFCIIWAYNSSISRTLLSTLDILPTADCNIKGFCGWLSEDAAWQDRGDERLGGEKVGGTLRDKLKHHWYLETCSVGGIRSTGWTDNTRKVPKQTHHFLSSLLKAHLHLAKDLRMSANVLWHEKLLVKCIDMAVRNTPIEIWWQKTTALLRQGSSAMHVKGTWKWFRVSETKRLGLTQPSSGLFV